MSKSAPSTATKALPEYQRFALVQRIEHALLLVSFTTLGLTGLVQKFAQEPLSQFLLTILGGVESARQIHHLAALGLMLASIIHVLDLLYSVLVRRVRWTMLPLLDDFVHLYHDVLYYLGLRKHKGFYGRYSYAEKVEYLAVVWGTLIMGLTGFMMWNPIATVSLLPGESIPAAKAAHGGEAVLAVLSILIWHFYHVHVRHLNKSMFTGKITEEEMAEEHPGELAQLHASHAAAPAPALIRRRQIVFIPLAAALTLAFSVGAYRYVTLENTAPLTTIPKGETVEIFVPVTPTPHPTPTAAPTPTPGAGIAADSWDGSFSALFRNRCGTCHGVTKVSGLTLAKYADALAGGDNGPAIVPGNPDASLLLQVQLAGDHPGQLTEDEMQQVTAWIRAGAPEK